MIISKFTKEELQAIHDCLELMLMNNSYPDIHGEILPVALAKIKAWLWKHSFDNPITEEE